MTAGPIITDPNPLEGVPCKRCGKRTLHIELRPNVTAKDIGSFSIAGQQVKFCANVDPWPWAVCGNCGAESKGKKD